MKCERCIPARAGQPRTAAVWGALDEVHPCARGATEAGYRGITAFVGASLRARGNLFPLRRGV